MLHSYEKKGFIVLIIIIVLLVLLPQQLKKRNNELFLLPDLTFVEDYEDEEENTILIELNTADSITLTKVKGIGPVYTSRILQYRNLLGGYSDVNQLKEINLYYLNVDSVLHYFYIDKNMIQKRNLDTLSFREVLAHPYLDYENVKNIFNAKNKFNYINIGILRNKSIISDSILVKIEPYFE